MESLQESYGSSCKASMHDHPIKPRLRRSWLLRPSACRVTYVTSLNDTIKRSALDLLLTSLILSPHFRPLLLTVTAAKTRLI